MEGKKIWIIGAAVVALLAVTGMFGMFLRGSRDGAFEPVAVAMADAAQVPTRKAAGKVPASEQEDIEDIEIIVVENDAGEAADSEVKGGEEMPVVTLATEAQTEAAESETGKMENGSGKAAAKSEAEPVKKDCVLLFAGDVYLSDHVLNDYDRAGGIHGV